MGKLWLGGRMKKYTDYWLTSTCLIVLKSPSEYWVVGSAHDLEYNYEYCKKVEELTLYL